MDTMQTDRLVDDYLRRLEHAAAHMQRARRSELVAEIREHIETALGQERPVEEAAVRNVLERLGAPEDIVDAAEPLPKQSGRRAGKLEIAALIALIVPFMGWLIGIVLVIASRAWSRRDKLVGVLLLFLPVVVLGLGFVAGSPNGVSEPVPPGDNRPVGEPEGDPDQGPGSVELVLLVTGLPSVLYLGWQLHRERHPSSKKS